MARSLPTNTSATMCRVRLKKLWKKHICAQTDSTMNAVAQWESGAQPPQRPTIFLQLGKAWQRGGIESKAEGTSFVVATTKNANVGQIKSFGTLERKVENSLNYRAEVGSLFRLRLQRLPTSIYRILFLLFFPKWFISFDNAEK